MAKQYKLKFRPTKISRLLRRPTIPHKMVGYPTAHDWSRYYALNYAFMLHEKLNPPAPSLTKEEVAREFGTQFHEYV